jgi:hypothetical protein
MKLMVKTVRDEGEAARQLVTASLFESSLILPPTQYTVSRVFPDRETGSRSQVVSIDLPNDVPSSDVESLVARLEGDPRFEYVHLPERRKFLASAG